MDVDDETASIEESPEVDVDMIDQGAENEVASEPAAEPSKQDSIALESSMSAAKKTGRSRRNEPEPQSPVDYGQSEDDEATHLNDLKFVSNKPFVKPVAPSSASQEIPEVVKIPLAVSPSHPSPGRSITMKSPARRSPVKVLSGDEADNEEDETVTVGLTSRGSPMKKKSPHVNPFQDVDRNMSPIRMPPAVPSPKQRAEEDSREILFSDSEDEGLPKKTLIPAAQDQLDYSEPYDDDPIAQNGNADDQSSSTDVEAESIQSPALTSRVVDYGNFRERVEKDASGKLSKHGVTANKKSATGRAIARELMSGGSSDKIIAETAASGSLVESRKQQSAPHLSDEDSDEDDDQPPPNHWQSSLKQVIESESEDEFDKAASLKSPPSKSSSSPQLKQSPLVSAKGKNSNASVKKVELVTRKEKEREAERNHKEKELEKARKGKQQEEERIQHEAESNQKELDKSRKEREEKSRREKELEKAKKKEGAEKSKKDKVAGKDKESKKKEKDLKNKEKEVLDQPKKDKVTKNMDHLKAKPTGKQTKLDDLSSDSEDDDDGLAALAGLAKDDKYASKDKLIPTKGKTPLVPNPVKRPTSVSTSSTSSKALSQPPVGRVKSSFSFTKKK
eukprot:TRINITY_DN16649_c0_g1_i1.p1 TRINITY_DN16649_c0_g1~~TRINITY_DN16649_c0_g1_i1.p1  ORF type:complete len:663 (+),score=255.84 TRINITY_DN16649_c0_g1_i1:133-1989(+)